MAIQAELGTAVRGSVRGGILGDFCVPPHTTACKLTIIDEGQNGVLGENTGIRLRWKHARSVCSTSPCGKKEPLLIRAGAAQTWG